MKTPRRLRTGFLALAIAAALAGTATARGEVGKTLATHPLSSFDGTEVRLSSYRGDVVVVNFWASWCAPCRKELPLMNEWQKSWEGRGARVVAISIDRDVHKAREFANEAKLSLALFHDGPDGLARELDLPSLPCTFLIDRQGNVVSITESSSRGDLDALHRNVEALLAESPRSATQRAGMGASLPAAGAAQGRTP